MINLIKKCLYFGVAINSIFILPTLPSLPYFGFVFFCLGIVEIALAKRLKIVPGKKKHPLWNLLSNVCNCAKVELHCKFPILSTLYSTNLPFTFRSLFLLLSNFKFFKVMLLQGFSLKISANSIQPFGQL